MNTDLIKDLEKISSKIENRILKLKGHLVKENKKEYLEIIIYKGFSSSTTHPIDTNHENRIINYRYVLTECDLMEAPLSVRSNIILKTSRKIELFLEEKYWL